MLTLLDLIDTVAYWYSLIVIAAVVLTWLVQFNVINGRNQVVYTIGDFLYRATEPVLRPIRNVMPNLGGIDLSPIVLLLALRFGPRFLYEIYFSAVGGGVTTY